MAGEMVAKKKTAKAAKRGKGKAAKRGEEAPAHERFREIAHGEHREVRDILLALYDAFGKRNLKRAKTLHAEFCAHCGPHFRYEEEALHPLLEPIVGKVQVEHLNREHDRAIVDTIAFAPPHGRAASFASRRNRGVSSGMTRPEASTVARCETFAAS